MFCSYKYILEYNLPSVQSGCWYCQSNTSELNWGNNFLLTMWVRRQKITSRHREGVRGERATSDGTLVRAGGLEL